MCSTSQGEKRTNQDVARIAGHEFIHAMGLGHAFNKPGDVMCSTEDTGPTCGRGGSWFAPPSSLNLGAVAQMYGADGFANPNNYIAYESRFTERSTGSQPNVQPPSTPPHTKTSAFPNGCTKDDANYDFTPNGITLRSGASQWYTICNTGPVNYSFSTATRDTGFKIYVLPPETDVRDYVRDGRGYYYTCEDPDDVWHSKSNTCNVSVGSRIVLYNYGAVPITISGSVRT